MASGVGGEPQSYQTWVLKVSIHCEGCKKKVKKVLQAVHGVHTIEVDSKQNKVTVTGNVDAESLIRRLLKYGKHADIWPEKKPIESNSSGDAAVKGKERALPAEQRAANTEDDKQTDEGKDNSPPETNGTVNPDVPPSTDVATPESTKNEPAESEKDSEKQTSSDQASSEVTEKVTDENRKQAVEREASGGDGDASDSDGDTAPKAASFVTPTPMIPSAGYPQPVYTMSYNMLQPSTSYSYYAAAAPPPAMMSSYAYSGYPMPEYYSSDPYYGSMEPSMPVGSLDMFNDENPNACNLM